MEEQFSSKDLSHHGIVSVVCDQIGLVEMIDEIITYLEKTKNTEFTIKLIQYLNNQNIQARHSLWALGSQIAMIGEDVGKIKQHLGIQ